MDDRGLPDAVPLEHRDGLARVALGQVHRSSPAASTNRSQAWRPVGHLQRGVTERVGEGVAEAGRRRGLPQLDDEVRERRRGPSGPGGSRARTAIGIAIWARKIRSSNGSSDVPDDRKIQDADWSRIATAPTRTGAIWRRTGPLDRSQRRPSEMTRSTAPSEIRTRWMRVDHVGGALVGRDAQRVQAVVRHQEQEPQELERDGHEQEDADDRAVGSRGEAAGREGQQEQGERGRPEVRQPEPRRCRRPGWGPASSSARAATASRRSPSAVRDGWPGGEPTGRRRRRRTTSRRAPPAPSRGRADRAGQSPTSIPRPSAPAVPRSRARSPVEAWLSGHGRSFRGRSRDGRRRSMASQRRTTSRHGQSGSYRERIVRHPYPGRPCPDSPSKHRVQRWADSVGRRPSPAYGLDETRADGPPEPIAALLLVKGPDDAPIDPGRESPGPRSQPARCRVRRGAEPAVHGAARAVCAVRRAREPDRSDRRRGHHRQHRGLDRSVRGRHRRIPCRRDPRCRGRLGDVRPPSTGECTRRAAGRLAARRLRRGSSRTRCSTCSMSPSS